MVILLLDQFWSSFPRPVWPVERNTHDVDARFRKSSSQPITKDLRCLMQPKARPLRAPDAAAPDMPSILA